MPQLTSNFILKSKQPNFERDSFKTVAEMAAVQSSWIDEGHISYCEETRKHYRFNSIDNPKSLSQKTGMDRWIELLSDENIKNYFLPPTQDIFVIDKMDKLTDDLATGSTKVPGPDGSNIAISLGKLVYVKENNKFYYNAYDQGQGIQYNDYLENHSGWFHPLISNKDFESYVGNKFIEYGYCVEGVDEKNKPIIKSKADTFLTETTLGSALQNSVTQDSGYLKGQFDKYVLTDNFGTCLKPFFDETAFDKETNKYKFATQSDLNGFDSRYLQASNLDSAIRSLGPNCFIGTTYATKDELGLDSVQPKPEDGKNVDLYSSMAAYIIDKYATIELLDEKIRTLTERIATLEAKVTSTE